MLGQAHMTFFFRTLALAAVLALPCAGARADVAVDACVGDPIVDWSSQPRTVERLQIAYVNEIFERLDHAMSCLSSSTRRFAGGESAPSAIYFVFRSKSPFMGTLEARARRTASWNAQTGSMFAEFALLRQGYDAAWTVRGDAYAQSVSPEKFRAFYGELAELESRMMAASPKLRDTAIWHNLMLSTVLDQQHPRSDPKAVFVSAVQRWPEYYDFQDVMLGKLLPRWGGSWPDVDTFVTQWARNTVASEGDYLYSWLYVSVLRRSSRASETMLDPKRMDRSLREWVRRYPTPENFNIIASAACEIDDRDLFREVYGRLAEAEVKPSTWLYYSQREPCVARYIK
jgi:hypothetical protein